jgi:hypothetical protein
VKRDGRIRDFLRGGDPVSGLRVSHSAEGVPEPLERDKLTEALTQIIERQHAMRKDRSYTPVSDELSWRG